MKPENKISNRIVLLSFFLFAFSFQAFTQIANFNYQEKWKAVDSLFRVQLPESGLKLADSIYQHAIDEKNQYQQLVAWVNIGQYQLFKNQSLENYPKILWTNSMPEWDIPNQAILHVYEGSFLAEIYRRERYKLLRQPKGVSNPEDINTWDIALFRNRIDSLFRSSLEHADLLAEISSKKYPELVENKDENWNFRPTLLDLIAWKALDFYMQSWDFSPQPFDWVRNNSAFDKKHVNDAGPVLEIFDLLEKQHADGENQAALFYVRLERLKYIFEHSELPNKETLYQQSLARLKNEVGNNPFKANVIEAGANLLRQLANKYVPDNPEREKYRLYLADAAKKYQAVIDSFPEEESAARCKSMLNQLKKPQLSLEIEKINRTDNPFPALVNYSNLSSLTAKIYRVTSSEYLKNSAPRGFLLSQLRKEYKNLKLVREFHFKLKASDDYRRHSTETAFQALPSGQYYLEMTGDCDSDSCAALANLCVSKLTFAEVNGEVTVLNLENGKPTANVNVATFRRGGEQPVQSGITDRNGLVRLSKNAQMVQVTDQGDTLISEYYLNQPVRAKAVIRNEMHFFTDRAIYRNGQNVFFKGILIEAEDKASECISNQSVKIFLRGSNYAPIDTIELVTNQFGSVSGSFGIPPDALPGIFSLDSKYGRAQFRVESYRRPGFEIKLSPGTDQVKLNGEVKLGGTVRSFSGLPLKQAVGKFRISKSSRQWSTNKETFKSGTFTTNDRGEFSFSFIAESDSLDTDIFKSSTFFNAEVEVTDVTGETQTASKSVSIGNDPLNVTLSAPYSFDYSQNSTKQKLTVGFSILNFDRQPVPCSGKIELISLKMPEKKLISRNWQVPDNPIYSEKEWKKLFPDIPYGKVKQPADYEEDQVVAAQKFEHVASDSIFFGVDGLRSGFYKVKLLTTDEFGKVATAQHVLQIQNTDQKNYTIPEAFWSTSSGPIARAGENATVTFGGMGTHYWSVKVMKDDSTLATSQFLTENELKKYIFPIDSAGRGQFHIEIYSVYKGECYSQSYPVLIQSPPKKLEIHVSGIPKEAEPGTRVTCKVKVVDMNGNPVKAELAGVVYDASLDRILPNNWKLELRDRLNYYNQMNFPQELSWGFSNCRGGRVSFQATKLPRLRDEWGTDNSELRVFSIVEDASPTTIRVRGASSLMTASASVVSSVTINDSEMADEAEVVPEIKRDEVAENPVKLRADFRETAWFSGQIKTDENGEANVSFTLPESITEWKFMALAHTRNVHTGNVSEKFFSRKKLMLEPYAPRFLKVGDVVDLPVKVTNSSGRDQNIGLELKIFQATTGLLIDSLNFSETIDLKNDQSKTSIWKLEAPSRPGLYKLQISARGQGVSDGYETILPVEPDKMWVYESQALSLKPDSKFEFKVPESWSGKNSENEGWEINLFTNSLGLVLDALPRLLNSETDNLTGTLWRLRGALTLRKIMHDYPQINKWISRQREKMLHSPDSVQTLLEQSARFTSLKLSQTPWISDAEHQKQLLLKSQPDSIRQTITRALKKIKNAQGTDGGFSWCPGMPSSDWITAQVLFNLSEIDNQQLFTESEQGQILEIEKSAVHFLDQSALKEFSAMTDKQKESFVPDAEIIDWLHIRHNFGKSPFPENLNSAYKFYYEKALKNRLKYGLWQQVQLAILFNENGDEQFAKQMLKSFTERAEKNKETGMFWKLSAGPYFYQENKLVFQSRMIDFYREMIAPRKLLDAMYLWLLQQKRTHSWNSAIGTSAAISSILLSQEDNLEGKPPLILLDGKPISVKLNDDPTGRIYLKLNTPDFHPGSKIEITNEGNSLLFGGLFHGYFKPHSDLSKTEGPLKIRKELYLLNRSSRGDSLVSDFSSCRPGDVVRVRLVIETDRDLGFVSLVDQRPAGTEPMETLSKYEYHFGLWYYRVNDDSETRFYFDRLAAGRHQLEYDIRVSHLGEFSGGRAIIQCHFAPEFGANHGAGKLKIDD